MLYPAELQARDRIIAIRRTRSNAQRNECLCGAWRLGPQRRLAPVPESHEGAAHPVNDAPVLPAIDLPALGENGPVLAPPLALPTLPYDLHAADLGHDCGEVLVQAPVARGDHDEELDARERLGG